MIIKSNTKEINTKMFGAQNIMNRNCKTLLLKEAEKFGPQDKRLFDTLESLVPEI